jgi:hypothetical protein
MKKPDRSLALCAALSATLFLAASAAAADLTVVSKVTFGGSTTTSTQYMTSEWSRSTDGQNDTIAHYPTGKMTMVDHKKKQYYETSVEEMSAYLDRATRDLKGSPMEQMFGLAEEAEVEKLPGKQKIAGYDCERYSVSFGNALELDLWVAPSLQPPPRYFEGRKLSYAAMGPMGKLFEKAFDEMKKIKGFPLSTAFIVRTPMSRTETVSEATEVRKGAIPASTFELPAGYKKAKSPFAK